MASIMRLYALGILVDPPITYSIVKNNNYNTIECIECIESNHEKPHEFYYYGEHLLSKYCLDGNIIKYNCMCSNGHLFICKN